MNILEIALIIVGAWIMWNVVGAIFSTVFQLIEWVINSILMIAVFIVLVGCACTFILPMLLR